MLLRKGCRLRLGVGDAKRRETQMSPKMLVPLSAMVAANPVYAGVAYFNNPVLFDGIIEDDLVIRETFETGDSASADGQTVFCDTPLTVRLNYSDSMSPFALAVQDEGDPLPPIGLPQGFGYDTTLPDGEGTFLQVSGGAETGSWSVEFETPGEMAAFGFTMTGFDGGRRDADSESGFLVEFIQGDDVVEDEYVELDASFADRFHGFVTGATFDAVRVSVYGGDYVGFDDVRMGFVEVPAPGVLAVLGLAAMGRRRRG